VAPLVPLGKEHVTVGLLSSCMCDFFHASEHAYDEHNEHPEITRHDL
jgi:hypothetical protein